MTITINKRIYTYKDYEAFPEGAPYQLIGGELIITPSTAPYHQRISKRLEYILYEYAEKKKQLGEVFYAPVDVYLEETEVYQPDIIFISKERASIIEEKKINGAPDLVIEILSPSSAYYDLRHKMKVYAKHGVKEYWIVDPDERSIEIYENINNHFFLVKKGFEQDKLNSKLIPGLEISLKDVF